MRNTSGFTLIELMITVVIVAILAAIAYPSYTQYIQRTNRSAAQQFMLEIANREQQYLMDTRLYTATVGTNGLNLTEPSDVTGKYSVTVVVANSATPPTFTITATPVAGGPMSGTPTMTLNSAGVKNPPELW